MHEVVLVREESLCDVERELRISLLYLIKRSEDDDTIDPEVFAL